MHSAKQHKTALFIGRFQPFHNGHFYSLRKCLEIAGGVIVGIGSSQESGTLDNPWDYETRKKMVEVVRRGLGLQGESLKVVALPDYPSDEEWIKETVECVGAFDVVVSNNEWTLSVFREAGYPVLASGLYRRDELEGKKIREMMREGDERWRLRVPEQVVRLVQPTMYVSGQA